MVHGESQSEELLSREDLVPSPTKLLAWQDNQDNPLWGLKIAIALKTQKWARAPRLLVFRGPSTASSDLTKMEEEVTVISRPNITSLAGMVEGEASTENQSTIRKNSRSRSHT